MADSETADDSSHLSQREFVHRAGIVIGLAAATALLTWLFIESIVVFFLLFAAILWATFLRGLAEFMARYTPIPPRLGLAIVLLVLLGSTVLLGVISGPKIVDQWQRATEVVPQAIDEARNTLQASPLAPMVENIPSPEQIMNRTSEIWKGLQGIFASALGVFGNMLVIFAVGLYIAISPDRYKRGIVKLLPLNYRGRAANIIDEAATHLGWWLGGRAITMTAVGLLTTIGLTLLGIPLALLVGVLTGLLTFVPVVGAVASGVPAALLGLLKGPMYLVYVIALYFGVQIIENYLLTPIVGERVVHIPPALLLMTQVLIGLLTGLFGLLLATPLLVLLLVVVQKAYLQDVLGETEAEAAEVGAGD
jgi:predicted PurR-regulated permease PerM